MYQSPVRPPLKGTGAFTQFDALFRKQGILQRRRKCQICCQCFLPFFVLVLLVAASGAAQSFTKKTISEQENPTVTNGVVSAFVNTISGSVIPYVNVAGGSSPSPSQTQALSRLIGNITSANIYKSLGGSLVGNLPPTQQFSSKSDSDSYIFGQFKNGPSVASGYLINAFTPLSLSYSPYYNNTFTEFVVNSWNMQDLPGPMLAMHRAASAQFAAASGKAGVNYLVQFQPLPTQKLTTFVDFVQYLIPLMFVWSFNALFPVLVQYIVYEKENNLIYSMVLQGLKPLVYWAVQGLFYFIFYVVITGITIGGGIFFQLRFFVFNTISLLFAYFWVWGLFHLIPMSFLVAMCFRNTRTAQITCYFAMLLFGILAQVTTQQLYSGDEAPASWALVVSSFVPVFCFHRGLYYLATFSAIGFKGLDWTNMNDGGSELGGVFIQLIIEGLLVWAVFGFFYLMSKRGVTWSDVWNKIRCCKTKRAKDIESTQVKEDTEVANVVSQRARRFSRRSSQPDVDSERSLAGHLVEVGSSIRTATFSSTTSGGLSPDDQRTLGGLVSFNIQKTFVRSDGTKKAALKGVSLTCPQGTITAMLGSSGGGKTTFCNCILGRLPKDNGKVYIAGYDLDTERSKIFPFLGVCPQFDAQWEDQTGREHLIFYGRLRGLSGRKLIVAVQQALEAVNLVEFADVRSKAYSGGMKRRLSVAIAFLGSPRFVLLDEPTTGMDVHSRREVWDAIQASKEGKAVLLTTHALEEAEALADRVCIVNSGNLECIGTVEELKNRYGNGYSMQIALTDHGSAANSQSSSASEAVKQFVSTNFEDAELTDEIAGTFKYSIPSSDNTKLSSIFELMESHKSTLKISDWALSRVTLESVFLLVTEDAKQREESASSSDSAASTFGLVIDGSS
ncbi:mitochondrial ABC transporter A family member 7-like [Andalucia godoyi]|uniref:Mitochondrial ABC transporter A family member 7-like n=1 Tax=Andalucia godoyi TaxID=505711 RepID=A0A8K0AHJ6_ANDGO|nr:mitochondrial ABC transporter A family member 7-like [Andalucia godoyi]|eukprot:ANDGO_05551.mRNA.1 mitochondrial ABC transporter A family member 7-like